MYPAVRYAVPQQSASQLHFYLEAILNILIIVYVRRSYDFILSRKVCYCILLHLVQMDNHLENSYGRLILCRVTAAILLYAQ